MAKSQVKIKPTLYTSKQAAEYLGIGLPLFKYHVYVAHNLAPDYKFGINVAYTRETLDEFRRKYLAEGMTIKEAAIYLGVPLDVLRYHAGETKLLQAEGQRGMGGAARYTRETLDAFKQTVLRDRPQPEPCHQ